MGTFIEIDGKVREVVRVKSDCPDHAGFYTTYRDQMKPGDEEYFDEFVTGKDDEQPVKHRRGRKKL